MPAASATATPERRAFYDRMAPLHLAPLWEVLHGLLIPQPATASRQAIWQ